MKALLYEPDEQAPPRRKRVGGGSDASSKGTATPPGGTPKGTPLSTPKGPTPKGHSGLSATPSTGGCSVQGWLTCYGDGRVGLARHADAARPAQYDGLHAQSERRRRRTSARLPAGGAAARGRLHGHTAKRPNAAVGRPREQLWARAGGARPADRPRHHLVPRSGQPLWAAARPGEQHVPRGCRHRRKSSATAVLTTYSRLVRVMTQWSAEHRRVRTASHEAVPTGRRATTAVHRATPLSCALSRPPPPAPRRLSAARRTRS